MGEGIRGGDGSERYQGVEGKGLGVREMEEPRMAFRVLFWATGWVLGPPLI